MKKHGITLIELLVVMAIIIVIAGITLPSFYLMSRGRSLQNAAVLITKTLSAARQMAIARQVYSFVEVDSFGDPVPDGFQTEGERTRYVEFDVPNNRYHISFWVNKKATSYKKAEKHYKKLIVKEWIKLPDKIEFYKRGDYHYPPAYIKFKPNGAAYLPGSGAPTIFDFAIVDAMTLDNDEEKIKTRIIEVTGITGSTKVYEK